jgi:hypothetical protein
MKKFPPRTLAAIDEIKYLKIRSGDHRYINIWVVVVDGRVFVRSWNDKKTGWYRAFLKEPRGAILVDDQEIPIRALPVKSAKLNDAATAAYGQKYTTKANAQYVEGFATAERKANTLELVFA